MKCLNYAVITSSAVKAIRTKLCRRIEKTFLIMLLITLIKMISFYVYIPIVKTSESSKKEKITNTQLKQQNN